MMDDHGIEFLCLARHHKLNGKLTLAVQNYISYFNTVPELSWDVKSVEEFIDIVCNLKVFIHMVPIREEIWNIMRTSINLFPDSWRLYNIMADVYLDFQSQEDFARYAFEGFQAAKKKGVPCLAIENKLLNVMWQEVPRWHFRMLNGKVRNSAYRKAIHRALEEGYTTALDVGAGCGLLSLYLGSHHTKPKIALFESNKTLYDLAILNLKEYCPDATLKCYQKNSNHVSDINFNANLLVTEIFDVAVFGEGIVHTLVHSLNRHMVESKYRIIPAKVNIFVTGITCKNLDRQFRLQNTISSLQIDENIYVTKNVQEDPYDAEALMTENFEILTETTEILELNFCDKDSLELIHRDLWSKFISLKGIKEGILDCLVVWFDLHLDEETVISTNPFHTQNEPCWEQAIFHCPTPITVCNNIELPFLVKIKKEHLHFDYQNNTFNSDTYFIMEENALSILNDEKWTKYLLSLSEMLPQVGQLTIFDFSSFPLIGLLLAKKGHKVIHVFENEQSLDFIQYLVKKNEINPLLLQFVQKTVYPACVLGQDEIHYVFYEPCNVNGSITASPLDNVIFRDFEAKSFFDNVFLNFELIHSPYLDYCNEVSEENVEPFKYLANNINIFSGTEHQCLPASFPKEIMTNVQTWNMKDDPTKILPLQVEKNGKVNGILTWFTFVGIGGVQFSTKESSCFNLKALLLPERKVEKNELLNIYCQYETGGFFKLEICEEKWVKTNFQSYNKYSLPIETFFSTFQETFLDSTSISSDDE